MTNLEVDGKGRDLLRERDEVDARVEQVGRKLGLEVDGEVRLTDHAKGVSLVRPGREEERNARIILLAEVGEVQERDDVDSELHQDRRDDVDIEDTAERSFLRELVDGLGETDSVILRARVTRRKTAYSCPRDAHEAD
jgi:hypothetical protein